MAVDVFFRWKCDECGAEHLDRQAKLCHLATIDVSSLPGGWHWIDGRHVCPLHEIRVAPLSPAGYVGMAKRIYDGYYGATFADPIPESDTPIIFRERPAR